MIKLDVLRAFVIVARHGNLRAAGDELGRTQSALSMALKQLEADLGGSLFETDRKRDLTDLGHFVRDVGEATIRDHDRAIALIHGYAKGEVGHLRIASVPSIAALILPDVLRSFMEIHSGARLDLMDSDSATVRAMVASGQADIGIAGTASSGPALETRPLFSDPLYVVCRATSDFASRLTPLQWTDLADEPLIVNETMRAVETPAAAGLIAQSRLSVRNNLSLLAMVDSGVGITVLPALATRSLAPSMVAIPLTGAGSARLISMLSRMDRTESPLSRAFRLHLDAALPGVARRLQLSLDR